MADQIAIENLLDSKNGQDPIEFSEENWAWLSDTNQGQYGSNQIFFDTSNLSQNDSFFRWSEAYLVMPTITQVTVGISVNAAASVVVSTGAVPYGVVPKSGAFNMVHQVQTQLDNKQIPQPYPFQNEVANVKSLEEMSTDSVNFLGSIKGVCPDTGNSWAYQASSTATAYQGYTNNRISLRSGTSGSAIYTGYSAGTFAGVNLGLQKRAEYTANAPANPYQSLITGSYGVSNLVGKNSYFYDATGGAHYWIANQVIPLKDISDIHKSLDFPVKALKQNLTIYTNAGSCAVTIVQATISTAAFNFDFAKVASSSFLGTSPYMMTNVLFDGIVPAANSTALNVYTASMKVQIATGFSAFNGGVAVAPMLTQCRLYVPYCKLPARLYRSIPTKKQVVFRDYVNVISSNVSGNINVQLANMVPNLKRVIALFYVSSAGNATMQPITPLLSPLADGNPCPAFITNENLLLNNIPFKRIAINYQHEAFMQDLRTSTLNGGENDTICSGLVNSFDFGSLYSGMKIWDVSRNPAIVSSNQSVQVSYQGTLQTLLPVDIHWFLECEKTCVLDTMTGQIIS